MTLTAKRKTHFYSDKKTGRVYEIDDESGQIVARSKMLNDCIEDGIFTPEFHNYNASYWRYNSIYRDFICQQIAEGLSLRRLSELPGMPSPAIIYRWRKENPDFQEAYEDALRLRAEMAAEELIDTSVIDSMDREDLLRERARDEKRRFHAEKFAPDRFGARVKHTGDEKQPIQMIINTGVPMDEPIAIESTSDIEGEYDVKSD